MAGRDGRVQLTLPLGHEVTYDAGSFLVGDGNHQAAGWVERWPDWPFTALAIVGPTGCGKTHLAAIWRTRAKAEAIDLTTADIERIAAVGSRTVIIDDCDRAVGDDKAERSLLQLYNLLRAGGGHLLLTAATPPSQWRLALPDLASRLNSAMVVAVDPPDDVLLASIAVKLIADRQLNVKEGVIAFLLSRGDRSVAALSRAVDALDRASLADKRPITVPLAREVLAALEDAS
jgi:DnaA regulatory inactivator Hda